MSTPVAHAVAAFGAYLGATGPRGTSSLRGGKAAGLAILMGLLPDIGYFVSSRGALPLLESPDPWLVKLMHGAVWGAVVALALAGAVPEFRKAFWMAALLFFAAHTSHGLLDWCTVRGEAWLAPLEGRVWRIPWPFMPDADARVVWLPFVRAVKIMLVELVILLPPIWTAWILGRKEGEAKTKAWLAAYAASWPAAAVLAWVSAGRRGVW